MGPRMRPRLQRRVGPSGEAEVAISFRDVRGRVAHFPFPSQLWQRLHSNNCHSNDCHSKDWDNDGCTAASAQQ